MKTISWFILLFSLSTLCFSTFTEDGKEVIEFQVVAVDGNPIEGAEAELLWPYQMPEDGSMIEPGCLRTVTNGRGWFRFEVDDYLESMDTYVILVYKEEYSIGWKNIFTNEEPITLCPPSSFSGKVVDDAGNPVAGAEVEILEVFLKTGEHRGYSAGTMLKPSDVLSFLLTRTDEAGRFVFNMFAEGMRLHMKISKQGYGTWYTYQVSEEIYYPEQGFQHPFTGEILKIPYRKSISPEYIVGMQDAEFVLKPEATVQGIVKDGKSEKPLADIPLYLFLADGAGVSPVYYHPKMPCKTDADGRFVYRGLEKGTYVLSFEETGHAYARDSLSIDVSEGRRCDVVFELTQGGTLDLQLVDSRDHRPLDHCTVYLETPQIFSVFGLLQTDDRGQLIQNLIPGTYKINGFYKQGHGRIARQHVFDIQAGQTTSLSLELQEHPKTTVVIKDPDGQPVRDFSHHVVSMDRDIQYESVKRHTESLSGVTIWSREPIEKKGVGVLAVFDFKNNLVGMTPVSVPGEEVTLTLAKGLKLSGTVLDPDETPVTHQLVHVEGRYQKDDILAGFQISCHKNGYWTDSNGHFMVSAIPDSDCFGHITLTIMPKGYSYVRIPTDRSEAVDGVIALPVITVELRGYRIRVQVVDEDGDPVVDASVMTVSGSDTTVFGKTDVQGRFSFTLSKWPVVILAKMESADDRVLQGSVQVTDQKQDVKIVMKTISPETIRK